MDITKKMYIDDISLVQPKMHEKIKSNEVGTELTLVEIMALQLELDDEQLAEWREKRPEINFKSK
jgi:hypothetical protein